MCANDQSAWQVGNDDLIDDPKNSKPEGRKSKNKKKSGDALAKASKQNVFKHVWRMWYVLAPMKC